MFFSVKTGEVKEVSRLENVISGDFLEGCFISCIVYDDGRAIMGHYGPHKDFGKVHLNVIRTLHYGKVEKAVLYCLSENDFTDMHITLEKYQKNVGWFKEELEDILNIEVKIKKYFQGKIVQIDYNRRIGLFIP